MDHTMVPLGEPEEFQVSKDQIVTQPVESFVDSAAATVVDATPEVELESTGTAIGEAAEQPKSSDSSPGNAD